MFEEEISFELVIRYIERIIDLIVRLFSGLTGGNTDKDEPESTKG